MEDEYQFLKYMEQHHFKELCLTLLSFYFDEFNWNIEYNLNSNLNDFHMYASRIETEKFEKSIELSSTFYKKDDDNIDFLREKLGFNKSLEKLGVLEKIKKVYFVVCHNSKEDEFNSIVNSVIRSTIRHFYSSKLEEVEERLKKEEIEEKKLKEERFPREKSREDERRISRDRYFLDHINSFLDENGDFSIDKIGLLHELGIKIDEIMIIIINQTQSVKNIRIYSHEREYFSIKNYGIEDIIWMIESNIEFLTKYSPILREKAIKIKKDAFLTEIDMYKKKLEQEFFQKRLKQVLRKAYSHKMITLFTGAGISKNVGLSTWDNLLENMMKEWMKDLMQLFSFEFEPLSKVIHEKQKQESSLIIEGEFIEKANVDVIHSLSRNILRVFNPKSIVQEHLHLIKTSKSDKKEINLIRSILILASISSAGLDSIITYNYDTLLEQLFEWHNKSMTGGTISRINYTTISNLNDHRKDEFREKFHLPLYHVHGAITAEIKTKDRESIVFSDEDYFHIVNDPYYWGNVVQLFYLRENICLFIGLSGYDPNLRRLLRICNKGCYERRLFMFKVRFKIDDLSSITNMNDDRKQRFADLYNAITEISFRELGLEIIWVNEYSEIPDIIRNIMSERSYTTYINKLSGM